MNDLDLDQFFFDDSFLKDHLSDIDLSSLTEGKNLRSRLIFLMGKLHDLTKKDCRKLGRVVELVHNATLTHDDVIDNSHTRRNAPSVPALINNKKSVLLGDYMLAKALHELSDFNNPPLTKQLTLTLKDLVEGEWIQYENTNPYEITSTLYNTLALKKTGSLFRWCFIAPHLTAKDSEENETFYLLSEFGETLGIIFQMTDDLIDFNPQSKKSYGLDFRNNNINYVLHFMGEKYPELSTKLLRTEEIKDLSDSELVILKESITLAQENVQIHLKRCHEILEKMKEKYVHRDHTPLSEFSSILDLVADRVH